MSTGAVVLHEGDNRVSLRTLPENSIDAVVTDPPYSLTSITKRFGKPGAAPARTEKNDGSFARVSGGFMGKKWDASGIERDPEFWADVYRVLKPGGFVFAFAGARTGHWQATAMEIAGFIMHPMHAWLYGQGFPKGHDAARAIDKHLGVEGGFGAPKSAAHAAWIERGAMRGDEGHEGWQRPWMEDEEAVTRAASTYVPGSPEAQAWDGWKYGTQTQKPAMEPIYLGQKPYDGKPVESILKWGVGAFCIDGCRVPFAGDADEAESKSKNQHGDFGSGPRTNEVFGKFSKDREDYSPPGRYSANVLHDGSDAVVALFPQTGVSSGGSAARFFNSFPADDFPWPMALYHSKAGKADRRAELVDRDAGEKPHPTVKPIGLLRHLVRHICPPGGTVLDPFGGTGTTAEAARLEGCNAVLMEAEPEYIAFLRRRFDLPDPLTAMFG